MEFGERKAFHSTNESRHKVVLRKYIFKIWKGKQHSKDLHLAYKTTKAAKKWLYQSQPNTFGEGKEDIPPACGHILLLALNNGC